MALVAGVFATMAAPAAAIAAPSTAAAAVIVPRSDLPFPAVFEDASAPVADVAVTGVSQYAAGDLLRFAVAHERTSLGRSTVAGTVAAIELIYREDGYLLTEARASFAASSGRLTIEVFEGYIDRIRIEGLSPRTAAAVERYMRPLLHRRPLRNADFERAFMLSSDLSGLYLRSSFSFDAPESGALLTLTGYEDRHIGGLTVDTVPVYPDTGARTYLVEEGRSLLTGGDMLRGFGVLTFEPNSSNSINGSVFYRAPVGSSGTYLEAFGGNAFSRRRYLEVTAESEQTGVNGALAVGHPLKRDLHNYVYLIGEVEYGSASARLGDSSFDSAATSLRAYVVQGHTTPGGGLFQWSATLSAGVRPDRAADALPDGEKRFAHARGSIGTVTALPAISERAYLRFEIAGQLTTVSLPEIERFGMGFQPYLRGYVPWEAEGDRGAVAAAELSYLRSFKTGVVRELMPFVFADAGTVDLIAPQSWQRSSQALYSAGGGLRISLGRNYSSGIWVGVPLKDGTVSRAGRPGFYARLTRGW